MRSDAGTVRGWPRRRSVLFLTATSGTSWPLIRKPEPESPSFMREDDSKWLSRTRFFKSLRPAPSRAFRLGSRLYSLLIACSSLDTLASGQRGWEAAIFSPPTGATPGRSRTRPSWTRRTLTRTFLYLKTTALELVTRYCAAPDAPSTTRSFEAESSRSDWEFARLSAPRPLGNLTVWNRLPNDRY